MGPTQYAVIRPTVAYGPHDHFNLEDSHVLPASIVKAVRRMDPYEVWGDGQEVRCFTYIDDFVDGLLRCVEHHATAEPLNICTAESSTVERMIRILLEVLNFHPQWVFRADKPTAIPYKVSDPSRARRILGWEAKVRLEEGIRRTVDWYRESVSRVGATAAP
jgi:nucleoside-diphosphate-sugar epimerase